MAAQPFADQRPEKLTGGEGRHSCNATSSSALKLNPPLCEVISKATRAGVATTPKRLETEALHSAAGTLPRAIEVKAIDD